MEAATNAAKAVFGINSSEPISGASGDVSKGEPYDAGNMEANDQERVKRSMEEDGRPDTSPEGRRNEDHKPFATDEPQEAGPGSSDASKRNEGDSADEPVDVSGAGPRSVGEIAKEHGGDAGVKEETNTSSSTNSRSNDENQSYDKTEGESEGTGEKYVKTSGFHADGGDFDATKPGAGREADRLMDEKDPSRAAAKGNKEASQPSETQQRSQESSGGGSSETSKEKEKESMIDKIKHKLHKH